MINAGESSENILLTRVEWHKAQNARLSRIAAEMGRLFTPGHNTSQSAEYEAWRVKYMQAMCDQQWHDYSDPPPEKEYLTCG